MLHRQETCTSGMFTYHKEVSQGRMEDALALRGEEGRDKLR